MHDKGGAHCVDARTVKGRLMIVYASNGAVAGMHTERPLQKNANGTDGFFVVIRSG